MAFFSILFDEPELWADLEAREAPDFFKDLNLDQVVASITANRDEYNLRPIFHMLLNRLETVNYRYDAFKDLENDALLGCVRSFTQRMRSMRAHLAQAEKLYYNRQKQSWFLDAMEIYCGAVQDLICDLTAIELHARAFIELREYVTQYSESAEFASLATETRDLKARLAEVKYSLFIDGKRIEVSQYESEPDYGSDVLLTFERFKRQAPKEYRFRSAASPDMNHVEAAVLDMVAQLFPELFSSLELYCAGHRGYLDNLVVAFDREVQFYLACIEHIEHFKKAGLPFCYPAVSDQSKEVSARDTFDLALANRLIREHAALVTNDFDLRDPERMIVVSGPNQGGKTTFARTFGQVHYLASIGCPVPGRVARLFLFDRLFTHFEREEDIQNLSSKLEDELVRVHRILESATSRSILIMNESFLATTLSDALFLSREVMQRVIERDILCVSVTFLDELASLSKTTVSMVSTVDASDPALRTFKVIRRPADGLAYAVAIAEKYRLTYEQVKSRIVP